MAAGTGTSCYVANMRSDTSSFSAAQEPRVIPSDLVRMSAASTGQATTTKNNLSRHHKSQEELREGLEERQREIRKTFQLIKQASKVIA